MDVFFSKPFRIFLYLSISFTLLSGFTAIAQTNSGGGGKWIPIKGTVSSATGSLTGVAVAVKGTSVGAITNSLGEFEISVPNTAAVLQFMYLGYRTEEITVGNRRVLSVVMTEDAMNMEEVTVVAFGTQKKESVIGSITTINTKNLSRPTSNLTTTLAGNMAGVIAYQRSGEPGQDNADFFVRGITTFGTNTNPLILIDGIELTSTDLARLQPDDIASFSIMKDATATALYGARGANGVILVTTKEGTVGPAKVSFRFENSFSMPTKNIELADPITYMQLYNEALYTRYTGPTGGVSLDGLYSQEKIDNTIAGVDPVYYPATNWQNELLKNFTTNQRVNLSVSGGGGVARYYVSAALNHDTGMFNIDKRNNFNNNISNNSYTLRSNVNINLTKTTEMVVRLSGVFDDYSGPVTGGTDMYDRILHSNTVLFPAYYERDEEHKYTQHIMFGNADKGQYINPYADLVRGYKNKSRSQMQASLEAKQELDFITEGLSLKGMFNISRLSQFSVDRYYNPFYYKTGARNPSTGFYRIDSINDDGTEYLGYSENPDDKIVNSTFYGEATLNYARTFNEKHYVSGLVVFMARSSLNANTGNLQLSLPSRNIGLSGRATYAYDSRYFAEFNFGYNGSERFHKSRRFGFFPSVGAAWLISNEKFWEGIKPVVSNLKLRYSYGKVGNDRIGSDTDRFFYLSQMNMDNASHGAYFGETPALQGNGVSIDRYANPEIGWEISTKQNYALELGLWNKLTIIAEYFTENRENILMGRASIPSTMGLAVTPQANLGAATGKGVDLSLEYQQSFNKDFWASARANFTFARSKYSVFEEPEYAYPWRYRVGQPINQMYGYIAERLFVDDEEALNSPRQLVGNQIYGGGDIKYTDINKDGVIDENDIVPIGFPSVPEIVYGFGFSVGYKGFDLSAFFQGQARQSFFVDATATSPFNGETQLLKAYADSHWSEDNQNVFALWPRLSTFVHGNNSAASTYHLREGRFLRLKQLEIGYTIPSSAKWMQKINLSGVRFYVSGTNLLLFSKFKLWDVEMGGNGLGYPLQRVFNMGVNITFN